MWSYSAFLAVAVIIHGVHGDDDGENQAGPKGNYDPTWESLDSRPLPDWYDKAKIGIMVHWGLYSVPAVGSEWFWFALKGQKKPSYVQFMRENYKTRDTYAGFANELTANFYNPSKWADLFEHSGAKYAIITAKHHDGYCMWPSPYAYHWNSLTSGPAKDVVGEFIAGMREKDDLKVGVMYSLFEWFHPIYTLDKATGFRTNFFPATKTIPELKDLVERYKPDIVWAAGDWEAPDAYWNSTAFLTWLYNESPVGDKVVVNDRWGDGTACKHGGFLNCVDRYNPLTLQARKWENVLTLDKFSWGHRRNSHAWDFLSTRELVTTLMETVSCGGNLVINVGVTSDGMINPIYEDRLLELGNWMKVNGEAIHDSSPWTFQNDTINTDVWYTRGKKGDADTDVVGNVYALLVRYPVESLKLASPVPSASTKMYLLGYGEVKFQSEGEGTGLIDVEMPPLQALTSPPYGWVIRMTGLSNA